jgi:hypothetical protein
VDLFFVDLAQRHHVGKRCAAPICEPEITAQNSLFHRFSNLRRAFGSKPRCLLLQEKQPLSRKSAHDSVAAAERY